MKADPVPRPQLDSETKLRFQAVGFIALTEGAPRLKLPGLGFQPGFVPSLWGASSYRGQVGGSPVHQESPQHLATLPGCC